MERISTIIKKSQKFLILIVFVAILTIMAPNSFPKIGNISNVLWSISTIGIMTAGSMFVILLGGIDLSVGSIIAVSGAIAVKTIVANNYSTYGAVLGICLAILAGIAIGLVHGLIISRFDVPAFLITFASQIILLGLAQILLNNKIISVLNPKFFTNIGMKKILGFPMPIYFMLVIMLISYFVLSKTKLGRDTYAVGGNPVASVLSGISSKKITILAYTFSGLTAAISGIVLSSMNQQAMASAGSGYETEVITAIVIGGASLMGGEGSVSGTAFGVVLVGLLNNAMNLLELDATIHPFVKGLVIIIAVAIDTVGKDKSRKSPSLTELLKIKRKRIK